MAGDAPHRAQCMLTSMTDQFGLAGEKAGSFRYAAAVLPALQVL